MHALISDHNLHKGLSVTVLLELGNVNPKNDLCLRWRSHFPLSSKLRLSLMWVKNFKDVFASHPKAIFLTNFGSSYLSIFTVKIFFKACFRRDLGFFSVIPFFTYFYFFLFILTHHNKEWKYVYHLKEFQLNKIFHNPLRQLFGFSLWCYDVLSVFL